VGSALGVTNPALLFVAVLLTDISPMDIGVIRIKWHYKINQVRLPSLSRSRARALSLSLPSAAMVLLGGMDVGVEGEDDPPA